VNAANEDLGTGDNVGEHGDEGPAQLVLGTGAAGEGERRGDDGDQRILEHAGDAVVVLGGGEEDGVDLGDGGIDGVDSGGFVVAVEVLVMAVSATARTGNGLPSRLPR
jgi:hypothetical protein